MKRGICPPSFRYEHGLIEIPLKEMILSFYQVLKDHHQDVLKFRYRPESRPCRCNTESPLKVHEFICRKIRFIENGMVHCSSTLLIRWICSSCKRSFRHLPRFLEPFKRFVIPTISDMASKVLNVARNPYRNTTLNPPPRETHIVYNVGDGSSISHVTVWRWVQWMALTLRLVLSHQPEVGKDRPKDAHEFSPYQAQKTKCRENLYLARRLLVGQYLDSR